MKNRNILNHEQSIGRTKTYDYNVTRKQIDTTRKILAMNNKVLVHTGSLHFFKKYQQPTENVWLIPVPAHKTVFIFKYK